MGSVEKRGESWVARWRDEAGHSRAKSFGRKGDADRFLTTVQHELLSGTYIDPAEAKRTTVSAYAERWMAAQPWRESTRTRTMSVYVNHVLPAFGDRSLGSLRTSELQSWATGLHARLAPSTAESVFRLMAAICRAAFTDRLLGHCPTDGVRQPRREGDQRVPLTVSEVRALAEAIVPELRAAVILAGCSGLRQGELFGLTNDRVGWVRREIVVDRQLVTPSSGVPSFGPCKTARSTRTVPLPDDVMAALGEHVGTFGLGDDGLLFHRDGRPWPRNRAAEAIARASAAVGLDVGWHALRHHAASILIAHGLSVTAVAATLGHSPAECLKTYAAWWPNEHEVVRSAMARSWSTAALERLV
ncbi:MAG: tyrosine-type recombinase/integrase [Acidimicrobiia bacterium]